jgi:hypothetical protein
VFAKGKRIDPRARLKGKVTDNEFSSFVDSCLKANKSPGPDGFSNECVKIMSYVELEILREWACGSVQELREEMELWKWDLTLSNRWARVAKCMQLLNIPIELAEDANEDKEQRGTSWASATRELRRLRHRIEAVGGSKDQWEAGVWHMDKSSGIYYGLVSRPSGRQCHGLLQRGKARWKG